RLVVREADPPLRRRVASRHATVLHELERVRADLGPNSRVLQQRPERAELDRREMKDVPRHRHEGDAPLGPGPPAGPTPGSAHHRPRLSKDEAPQLSMTFPRNALVPISIARLDRVPPVVRARTDSFLTLSFLFLFAFFAMGSEPPSCAVRCEGSRRRAPMRVRFLLDGGRRPSAG